MSTDRDLSGVPPLPPEIPDDSAHRAANRLNSLAIHLLRDAARADVSSGLTQERLSALSVLVFGGPCTLGELARAERVTPPAITRIVTALEEAGLVERSPRPGDRRAVVVSATDEGQILMHRARAARLSRLADLVRGMGSRELATLETSLADLGRHLMSDARQRSAKTRSRARA